MSCLALIAAAVTLNITLSIDEPVRGAEEETSRSEILLEASVVAGALIAVAVMTVLVQAVFVLVTKLGPYEPASLTHLYAQIVVSCSV